MGSTKNLYWLWLSTLVIFLDQLTKFLAVKHLNVHEPVAIFPGLNLTLVYNEGAAFSFLSDAGGWQRWALSSLAMVVSVVLIVWLHRLEKGHRLTALALALILGGALGNVYDRILLGHVVDFIDCYYSYWHWPAFNIADSAICIGAGALVLDMLKKKKDKSHDESN